MSDVPGKMMASCQCDTGLLPDLLFWCPNNIQAKTVTLSFIESYVPAAMQQHLKELKHSKQHYQ